MDAYYGFKKLVYDQVQTGGDSRSEYVADLARRMNSKINAWGPGRKDAHHIGCGARVSRAMIQ